MAAAAVREERFEGVGGPRTFIRSWRPDQKPRIAGQDVDPTRATSHHLLNDVGKEKVMGDIQAWINAHLPRA
jgi:alpha-beta hydrolase superfamily lysophospholipase